jgi:hypothetical protein
MGLFLSTVDSMWETSLNQRSAPQGGKQHPGGGPPPRPLTSSTKAPPPGWTASNIGGVLGTPLDNLSFLMRAAAEQTALVVTHRHDATMIGMRPFQHRASTDRSTMLLDSQSPQHLDHSADMSTILATNRRGGLDMDSPLPPSDSGSDVEGDDESWDDEDDDELAVFEDGDGEQSTSISPINNQNSTLSPQQ